MAIYHLTVTVVSRGRGQSMVAAAAYRMGARLHDRRYGAVHNYVGKRGILHSRILAPVTAPDWVYDREALWNAVEEAEVRKDAQLARLVQVSLPVELGPDARVALVRDYATSEFVARGMIADFCIRGEAHNPHAHILLTLRGVTQAGFGPKQRQWNGKTILLQWRAAWASQANEHLARAGHDARIDHRTLEDQHIELTPARRVGAGRGRSMNAVLPDHIADRIADQQRIAHQNGLAILEDPTVALRALTHQRPTFTAVDLVRFLRGRTGNATQLDEAIGAVTGSPECVALDVPAGAVPRFTSRDMQGAAASVRRRVASMALRRGHGIEWERQSGVPDQLGMDDLQRRAFAHFIGEGDAKAAALPRESTAAVLAACRRAWEAEGFSVLARNCASEDECLRRDSVLVVEGSHTLGLKELERVLAAADHARAKVVLVADARRMQSAVPPPVAILLEIGRP